MKIGDTIETKNFGPGKIVKIEDYNRLNGGTKRYCLELVNNPFIFSPVCFWLDELKGKGEDNDK